MGLDSHGGNPVQECVCFGTKQEPIKNSGEQRTEKEKAETFQVVLSASFSPLSLSLSLYSSLQAGLIIRLSSYSGEATQMGGGLHKGLHKRRCEKEEIERERERETPNWLNRKIGLKN